MDAEEFRKELLESTDVDYGLCPPPTNPQHGINILSRHFLGEDWYTFSTNNEQANSEDICEILQRYPKRVSFNENIKRIFNGEIKLSKEAEKFKKELFESTDEIYGVFPPPTEAQHGLNILIDHFLGEDWYVVLSVSQQQVNSEAIYDILKKYPKRKSFKECIKKLLQ